MNPMDPHNLPDSLFREYRAGLRYKNALGGRGMAEQNRINGRFYIGDQWHGARCGESRPLVRHNIIKRIADYKMAVVGAAPVAVEYTAEGVPATAATLRAVERLRDAGAGGKPTAAASPEEEAALVASALSDYFRVTAERVNFTDLKDRVLRDAYITGTGVLYTYWDERIPTGQYADFSRTAPIGGDIACEVLDIDSVFFGDPAEEDVQAQPYILIAQRRGVDDLRRQARRRGCPDWRNIVPDREGPLPEDEDAPGGRKATLLTRFWKEWDETGERYTIMAAQVCRGVVVRPPWNLGVRLYPLAVFRWERGRGGAYGESEITYLIPNQIAINRMITASVWAVMMMGMPIMVVNGDVVTQPITNDPGQVVQVFGTGEDADKAIRYVSPPAFSPPVRPEHRLSHREHPGPGGGQQRRAGGCAPGQHLRHCGGAGSGHPAPAGGAEPLLRLLRGRGPGVGGVLDHPVRPAEPENPGRAGDVVSALRREPLAGFAAACAGGRGGLHPVQREPGGADPRQSARPAGHHPGAVSQPSAPGRGAQPGGPHPGIEQGE